MPKGSNHKYKFMYLMRLMLANTDDKHSLTMSQIIDELEKYGVTEGAWRFFVIQKVYLLP